mmetsp:Transcript_91658/g.255215  ORF Transcript_91658/g.255215 Transcript_91658/m.255215 type:complete len:296 (+) Transcript_91658:870-1757(+)
MPVDEGLDQHGVRDDVGTLAPSVLHLVVQLERLADAVCPDEAFDERLDEGAAGGVHGVAPPREQVDDGRRRVARAVVDDAGVEERAEGDVVGLDALRDHVVGALRATLREAGLREALDDGVVRDHIDDLGLRPLDSVRLLQAVQPPLRLARVHASQEQQVEHERRGRGPQLREGRLSGVHVVQRNVRTEEQDVVLGVKGDGPVAVQHRHGAFGVSHLQGRVDQARVHGLVRQHLPREDRVQREARREVLPAGEHLHGGLPELCARVQALVLHRADHALHDVDLADAHRGLHERRV